MKLYVKIPVWIIGCVIALAVLFFAISTIIEFRPASEEVIAEEDNYDVLPDTLRILSWNVGYAGLGDDMDFFMDGGQRVRDTRERTEINLDNILVEMKREEADIYFIQEVDRRSHRTYNINEIEVIQRSFPDYHLYYAVNFKSWFVPVPLKEPIGKVDAGLLILSKYKPEKVVRYQYPSRFPYPVSLFNLKRCLLSAFFHTSDGKEIMIGNTHCTAYDTGGMRSKEIDYLSAMLSALNDEGNRFIVGGDWNQYPPEYQPSREEIENKFFSPVALDISGIESFGQVACDINSHTVRYNDFVYSENSTRTILDFFVASNTMEVLSIKTRELNFHSSDHNPVFMEIVLID